MIALVTFYHSNYATLADLVLPNMRAYCERHGYSFLPQCDGYGDGPIGFQKMRYLKELLARDAFDAALVTDLDVLITNPDRRIEEFFDDSGDYFVTKDVNGINNGSFIIRNTPWARGFVDFIISYGGPNEQNVLKDNEGRFVEERLRIIPHPSINSYPHRLYPEWADTPFPNDWKEGDFLMHLPGKHLDERLQIFQGLL